jgi:hypothetical protein
VGTVNVGSRAPTCPILLLRYVRGDTLPYNVSASDQDANQIDFQSGDPEITFLIDVIQVLVAFNFCYVFAILQICCTVRH